MATFGITRMVNWKRRLLIACLKRVISPRPPVQIWTCPAGAAAAHSLLAGRRDRHRTRCHSSGWGRNVSAAYDSVV